MGRKVLKERQVKFSLRDDLPVENDITKEKVPLCKSPRRRGNVFEVKVQVEDAP